MNPDPAPPGPEPTRSRGRVPPLRCPLPQALAPLGSTPAQPIRRLSTAHRTLAAYAASVPRIAYRLIGAYAASVPRIAYRLIAAYAIPVQRIAYQARRDIGQHTWPFLGLTVPKDWIVIVPDHHVTRVRTAYCIASRGVCQYRTSYSITWRMSVPHIA
eukprot:3006914-Rhodomonas_salina.3